MNTLEKDTTLEVAIESLAIGGRGVAHADDGLALFVERGLPGQRALVRVTQMHKRFAEAELVETLEPSPYLVEQDCPHFADCGGCAWRHLEYAQQLRWKQRSVEESFRRLAGLPGFVARPTLPSPKQEFYRNKMEFAFDADPSAPKPGLRLGLRRRDGAGILEVTGCRLQSERSMELLAYARERLRKSKARPFDPETGQGYWRFLVIRESGEDCLLQCITTDSAKDHHEVDELADKLRRRFPWLIGVAHALRRHPAQVAQGESLRRAYGADRLRYALAGLALDVPVNAFFQPNTGAAELLCQTARDLAQPRNGEMIWDLYCGVGGFGLTLIQGLPATRLFGFEIEPSAVDWARRNAATNSVRNAQFRSGDMSQLMARPLAAESGSPDLLLVDPPRSGMAPDVVKQLLKRKPGRILYVSCDPATQARDALLLLKTYELVASQPVDLFPHTAHVENIALFAPRGEKISSETP
jgi:23S rRNA (uracil1939-C5)-methyltransferase